MHPDFRYPYGRRLHRQVLFLVREGQSQHAPGCWTRETERRTSAAEDRAGLLATPIFSLGSFVGIEQPSFTKAPVNRTGNPT